MDSNLFKEWFVLEFVVKVKNYLRDVKLPEKDVLVLDNAPTHPSKLACHDVKVMFLPPNVTSLVQPLDQTVIVNLKRRYRKCCYKKF